MILLFYIFTMELFPDILCMSICTHGLISSLLDCHMQQYFENRLKTLATQKAAGANPYPHKFHVSMSILEYIEKYETLESGAHLEDVQVSLAGGFQL